MKTNDHEVVFAIVNSGFAEDVMEVAREQGVRGGTILNARGVVREDLVDGVMDCLEDKFRTVRNGKGVCFAVPLASVIGVNLYQFLSDNRMGRGE